jgi:hypothetical protein
MYLRPGARLNAPTGNARFRQLALGTERRHEPHGYRRLSFQRMQQQQSSDGDSACHRSVELMQRVRYFSVMFLPKMKPNSSTARNWFASVPVLPKTAPVV